jgi:hypothetical protein
MNKNQTPLNNMTNEDDPIMMELEKSMAKVSVEEFCERVMREHGEMKERLYQAFFASHSHEDNEKVCKFMERDLLDMCKVNKW